MANLFTLKKAFVIVVAFLSQLVVGCGHESANRITIGATLPLTGEAALWGNNTKDGIEIAREKINGNGGINGKMIEVVYEDTKALPAEGVNAYRKLRSTYDVQAIIDNAVSSVTLAIAPLAMKDSVVVISTGGTSPKISQAGDFIFRIWNSDAYEGEVSATFAHDTLGLQRVAILYVNNEYGVGLEDVFSNAFVSHGGQVVASEAFEQNSTDMRTQIVKTSRANPQGIYIVGYPKEVPILLRQMKEIGVAATMIGTVAFEDPQLIEASGNASEGLVYPFPVAPNGEHVDRFNQEFAKRYGKAPGLTCDVGYDALMMIAKGIELSGGVSGSQVRNGLNTLKDYPGVSGTMTFDSNGDVHKPMGVKVVRNGKAEWRD